MGRARMLVAVAAGAVAIGVGVGACGGDDAPDRTTTVADTAAGPKVGIITPRSSEDFGWSRQGLEAARAAASRAGGQVEVVERVAPADAPEALRRLAADGAELLIAHDPAYTKAAAEVAADTDADVLVSGAGDDVDGERIAAVEIDPVATAYLAGNETIRASYTRSMGVVVSKPSKLWYRMAGAAIAGARAWGPSARVSFTEIPSGDDDDIAGGRLAAARLLRDHQSIVGLGQDSTDGMFVAVAEASLDHTLIDMFGLQRYNERFYFVLGTIVWDFESAFADALADVEAGRFGSRDYRMDLANDGVHLDQSGRISTNSWDALMRVRRRIVAGEVKIPDTPTREAVVKLVRENGGVVR